MRGQLDAFSTYDRFHSIVIYVRSLYAVVGVPRRDNGGLYHQDECCVYCNVIWFVIQKPLEKTLRYDCTQDHEKRDCENLRAFENHPKVVLWEIGFQFCN